MPSELGYDTGMGTSAETGVETVAGRVASAAGAVDFLTDFLFMGENVNEHFERVNTFVEHFKQLRYIKTDRL